MGEICSIVAAEFSQISRSAIKKAGVPGQCRQVYAIENYVRSSLMKWTMAARISTVEAYDPQRMERYKGEALKLREIVAGVNGNAAWQERDCRQALRHQGKRQSHTSRAYIYCGK
nr:hypothetical protein [Serratia surfactantfaciens]